MYNIYQLLKGTIQHFCFYPNTLLVVQKLLCSQISQQHRFVCGLQYMDGVIFLGFIDFIYQCGEWMQTSDIIQQNIAFKSEDLRKLLSSLLLSLHTSLDSATLQHHQWHSAGGLATAVQFSPTIQPLMNLRSVLSSSQAVPESRAPDIRVSSAPCVGSSVQCTGCMDGIVWCSRAFSDNNGPHVKQTITPPHIVTLLHSPLFQGCLKWVETRNTDFWISSRELVLLCYAEGGRK